MSKTTKIALISTGVILLGVIIYFSTKKKWFYVW
jgi:multisubunit Na+/H+ antiporter MnhG subunit